MTLPIPSWQQDNRPARFAIQTLAVGGILALTLSLTPSEALGKKNSKTPPSPIQAGIQWKESRQNPDNPSDIALTQDFPDKQWWNQFQDERLNRYIDQAVSANHQLAIMQARVNQSRALVRSALSAEFPSVSIAPSYTRLKNSSNQFPTFSGGSFSLGSFASSPYNLYSLPLQASYEADVFLKNWDKVRIAKRQEEAAKHDYRAMMIALIAEVSSTYFNMMAQDKQITLQKEYVRLSEADLDAERERMQEGLVSQEKVAIKEGLLADAKAALQDFYRLQAVAENQMAILLGQPPENLPDLARGDLDDFNIPASVDTGIPAELITRRPDILASERILEASRINILVARKEFLPQVNLNAQYGFSAVELAKLLKKGSEMYNFGGNVSQSIFQGGAKLANLKYNKERYQEQLHTYQQTILNALQEVNNSLAGLKTHKNSLYEYQASNAALKQQLNYQVLQYDEGSIAAADLYPTQLEIVRSEQGLVQSKLLGLVDMLTLYKALGGGY